MGLVFLAQRNPGSTSSSAPPQPVAIKVLKPELQTNPRAEALFKKEIRHLKQLDHPHILKPLEANTIDGRSFIVMPYFVGGNLADRIQRPPPPGRDKLLQWAIQISSALDYAHRKGVIHRDLKPANVLLDATDDLILADFGLARTVFNDSMLDIHHPRVEGTCAYLSPAMAAGEAEDTRCDIYAFGAVLYELLTGQPPYIGSSREEILDKIRTQPPTPVLSANPKAPADLARVTEWAMARRHRDRYANMVDVQADLDRMIRGLPPLGPQTALQSKVGSTHLAFWVVGVALAALLLGALLISRIPPSVMSKPLQGRGPPVLRVLETVDLLATGMPYQTRLSDYDGDGVEDLMAFSDGNLDVYDSNGRRLRHMKVQTPDAEAVCFDLVQDVDGDRLDEIFLAWRQGADRVISVRNQNLFEIKQFQTEGIPSTSAIGAAEYYYNRIETQRVADLDGDGHLELLAVLKTGYEKNLRGVTCFDYETRACRWHYETAPAVSRIDLADLDGDGRPEVIFAGNAVANHKRLPDGTTDESVWLYALHHDGTEYWKVSLDPREETYARVFISRSSGAKAAEIYVVLTRSWEFEHEESCTLIHVRADGAELRRRALEGFVTDVTLRDSPDGASLILADRHGLLHEFDRELGTRRTMQLVHREHDAADLQLHLIPGAQDAQSEASLICLSQQTQTIRGGNRGTDRVAPNMAVQHAPTLWILGNDLKPLANYRLADQWKLNCGFNAIPLGFDQDRQLRIATVDNKLRIFAYGTPKSPTPP